LLPVNVRAAQKVVANPRDVDAQRDLDDSNDQIRQALARVDNIVNPRLEEDLLARGDKVKAKGEELKAKAKAGDKKGATDGKFYFFAKLLLNDSSLQFPHPPTTQSWMTLLTMETGC